MIWFMGGMMLKDEEILFEALEMYASGWRLFYEHISKPGIKDPEGNEPTQIQIDEAEDMADQCEALAARAKEKMDSPIIVLQ